MNAYKAWIAGEPKTFVEVEGDRAIVRQDLIQAAANFHSLGPVVHKGHLLE